MALTTVQSGMMDSVAQYYGFKNRIINGGMVLSQRSTSATTVSGFYVALDRYKTSQVATTAVTTMSQSSDVPTGFQYSLRLTVNTADAAVASGDTYVVQQIIEGFNIADLVGQTFTISFWVRSSKTGIHCLSLSNAGIDRSYVAEYTISVANTWEYKTITVSGGIPSSGTWNFTNSNGLDVRWSLMGGATFQTTANSWNNGNFTGTSNQVNVLDTVGNIFAITGVQLEKGVTATSFDYLDYGRSLIQCQRYYNPNTYGSAGYAYNATAGVMTFNLPVSMRVTPTLGFTTGSSTSIDYIGGVQTGITFAFAYGNPNTVCYTVNGMTGRTAWQGIILANNNNVAFSAEL